MIATRAVVVVLLGLAASARAGGLRLAEGPPCRLLRADGSLERPPLKDFECDYLRVAAADATRSRRGFDALPADERRKFADAVLSFAGEEHDRYLAVVERWRAAPAPDRAVAGESAEARLRRVYDEWSRQRNEIAGAARPFLWPRAADLSAGTDRVPESWAKYLSPLPAREARTQAELKRGEDAQIAAAREWRRKMPVLIGSDGFDWGRVDPRLSAVDANARVVDRRHPTPVTGPPPARVRVDQLPSPPVKIVVLPPSSYQTASVPLTVQASEAWNSFVRWLMPGAAAPAPTTKPLPYKPASHWLENRDIAPMAQIPVASAETARRNYFGRGVPEGLRRLASDRELETLHAWAESKTIGDPYGRARLVFQQKGETCAIQAQYEAMLVAGKKVRSADLVREATARGIFDPKVGTMPKRMGDLLTAHGVANKVVVPATLGQVVAAMSRDGQAIVSVDVGEFWWLGQRGGHAIYLTGAEIADGGKVLGFYANDTGTDEGARFVSLKEMARGFSGALVELPRARR